MTATNEPDPQCASSGESAAPTPSNLAPRRDASTAPLIVSAVVPEHDTAMTRSAAPTQPGRPNPRCTTMGIGQLIPTTAASTSPEIPEPPMPATTMARGRESSSSDSNGASSHGSRRTYLRGRGRYRAQHVLRVCLSEAVDIVEPVEVVIDHPEGASSGRRASSTSNTGMLSRTG